MIIRLPIVGMVRENVLRFVSMPKFTDTTTWQQAELLMQPAFIRVVDNIRKQLEIASFQGSYQEVLAFPEGTLEETKTQVLQLQERLTTATPEEVAEIEAILAHLPKPYPGYVLSLQKPGHQMQVDLWEICYRVCFLNYEEAIASGNPYNVEIDTSLIESETGDVDWNQLDAKTNHIITDIFTQFDQL